MKLLNDEKIQKKILFVFLLIQPFLDCYLLYKDKVISIFGFSPTTIIRILFVIFMSAIVFLGKTSKKNKIIITIYLFLVALYSGMHILYDYQLKINNYASFSFSITAEALYIVRMLIPVGLAFLGYSIKFSKKDIMQLIYLCLILFSSIIIISNIFKISLPSYYSGTIKENIFYWFRNDKEYSAAFLASKGWFNSANQISGVYMLLLPIALGFIYDEFKISKVLIIFFSVIAMMILGTRTSSYGWVLNVVAISFAHLMYVAIYKKKLNKKTMFWLGIILISGGFVLKQAPIVSSLSNDSFYKKYVNANENINVSNNNHADNISDNSSQNLNIDDSLNQKLAKDLKKLAIHPQFYTILYPLNEHQDFWNKYLYEIPIAKKYGQRNIQFLITKDVDKNQKQLLTPYLGYGFSRFTNTSLYLEYDVLVHYYTIGILGIILLLAFYLIVPITCLFYMLIKRKISFISTILAFSVLEVLSISVITGHILDELIVTIYLGFVLGCLLRRVSDNEED